MGRLSSHRNDRKLRLVVKLRYSAEPEAWQPGYFVNIGKFVLVQDLFHCALCQCLISWVYLCVFMETNVYVNCNLFKVQFLPLWGMLTDNVLKRFHFQSYHILSHAVYSVVVRLRVRHTIWKSNLRFHSRVHFNACPRPGGRNSISRCCVCWVQGNDRRWGRPNG